MCHNPPRRWGQKWLIGWHENYDWLTSCAAAEFSPDLRSAASVSLTGRTRTRPGSQNHPPKPPCCCNNRSVSLRFDSLRRMLKPANFRGMALNTDCFLRTPSRDILVIRFTMLLVARGFRQAPRTLRTHPHHRDRALGEHEPSPADGKGASCQIASARNSGYLSANGLQAVDPGTRDYCRARAKLSEETLHALTTTIANEAERLVEPPHLWTSWHAKLVDGSTFIMADTPKNQAARANHSLLWGRLRIFLVDLRDKCGSAEP